MLESESLLTQKEIVTKTYLPARTVRYALSRLKEENLLLEDVQKFRLEIRVELADLVEEDGPVPRHLEPPVLSAVRSRKGSLFEAEELAFEQIPREGRAIDPDEGFVGAG